MSITIDRRTSTATERLTPVAFFTERFPALAEANGALVTDAMSQLDARPLSLEVGAETWSIIAEGDTLHAVNEAVDDALIITLDADEFSFWCQNERSLNSFMVAHTLISCGGDIRDISIWDSLVLSLLYGWPTVGEIEFVDRHGLPLVLDRAFTPQDDPQDIAHFIREAGFLHLRGWVDPTLMPQICADMDRVRPDYVEGDGMSWWAQMGDGTRVCVRMQEFVQHSPATAAMLTSENWDLLRRVIADNEPLTQSPVEGRCIEALIKPVGVISGPSDLTFHRDCHLGGHARSCSTPVIGVSLTASHPDNGHLSVIPGSHRIAMPVEIAKADPYLAPHALITEPGDLTVHLSCTLHEATAPHTSERRVMYTGFKLAGGQSAPSEASQQLAALREQVTNLLREPREPA